MQKILGAGQIKELDAFTIKNEPIASIDLMERACQSFVRWFVDRFQAPLKVGIICGTGNNGGDGLGVARILNEWGYSVQVWVVKGSAPETEDFKTNLGRLQEKIPIEALSEESSSEIFSSREVLIDAIFGSGLSRPAEGLYAHAIQLMNASEAVRIAVDIPSGLHADKPSTGEIFRAHFTVTFQLPKLAFLLPENSDCVGAWEAVDIGLSKSFIVDSAASYSFVTKKAAKRILRPRPTFSHKGDYGKALLISGAYGKMGACILGARACLRSGVGLLTVHVPKVGYSILQESVPEAMATIDKHEEVFTECPPLDAYDVVGVGPGIGQLTETVAALRKVAESGKPMVIDADALNIMGSFRKMVNLLPAGCILTPHPGEFERLVGSWRNDFERLEKQIKLARETKAVIVLKGAHTSIASPDGNVYFNSTGNPGMATGGSGDVLTGILTGLLAQKYSPLETAILGVYLHGLSGDLAARESGMNSLIASDLIAFLPAAFRSLL